MRAENEWSCASKDFRKMDGKDGNAFSAGMNIAFDKAGRSAASRGGEACDCILTAEKWFG